MKVQVIDEAALASPQPRNVRIYLRTHGWERVPRRANEPDVWTLQMGEDLYEIVAPSSHDARDFPQRIAEVLRTLSIVEDRSELEVLRDLATLAFDVQHIHSEHGGPPGTAPLRDAADAYVAAHSMFGAAVAALEEPRLVLPSRRPARAANLMKRVLAGPATEGSYVISIWVPVPPRLTQEEDAVLFDTTDVNIAYEPFERAATRFLNRALVATRVAAREALDSDVGIDSFVQRESEGVSANLCESLVTLSGDGETTFDVRFSWALDRPIFRTEPIVQFSNETIPVLREAARSLREQVPEDEARIRGNVVRLHREGTRFGAGEVTIAGVVSGDPVEKLRRVSVSLAEEDYQQAIAAHETYADVEIAGSLIQRGTRTYLTNARGLLLHPAPAE
jgi:hypothetical protein